MGLSFFHDLLDLWPSQRSGKSFFAAGATSHPYDLYDHHRFDDGVSLLAEESI
jgi:hypothetical protein